MAGCSLIKPRMRPGLHEFAGGRKGADLQKRRGLVATIAYLLGLWLCGYRLLALGAEPTQSTHNLKELSPSLPSPPPPLATPVGESDTNLMGRNRMKMVSQGVYEFGDVIVDKHQRTVTFPAFLNMNQGPLEYLLVTSYGKKHESLLRTDVSPFNIHMAMLLLDVPLRTNIVSVPPPAHIVKPSSEAIPGRRVAIELSWTNAGKTVRNPAEDLIYNTESKTTLSRDAWLYNGSAVWDGRFLAQREGSIVSLVTDLSALINNSGSGHDNDHIWTGNAAALPPVDTPVAVTFRAAATGN